MSAANLLCIRSRLFVPEMIHHAPEPVHWAPKVVFHAPQSACLGRKILTHYAGVQISEISIWEHYCRLTRMWECFSTWRSLILLLPLVLNHESIIVPGMPILDTAQGNLAAPDSDIGRCRMPKALCEWLWRKLWAVGKMIWVQAQWS